MLTRSSTHLWLALLVSWTVLTPARGEGVVDDMVLVPAGTFVMGDGVARCGVDEREVTLTRDLYLSPHEVTNQAYLAALQWAFDHGHVTVTASSVLDNLDGSTEELLMLDSPYCEIQFDGVGGFYLRQSPSGQAESAYPGGYDPANHPVKMVTWRGAARYCDWLSLQAGLPRAYDLVENPGWGDWRCNGGDPYAAAGYRLPTDAEFEYAARFDDDRSYPWGNEAPACDRVNFQVSGYCVGWTTPVGSYPAAPATLGLWDVAGNVFEWCNDWHTCDLGTQPVTDPPGPESGVACVLRGGCWFHEPVTLLCAGRYHYHPHHANFDIGFRVARTVPSSAGVGEAGGDARLRVRRLYPNPSLGMVQVSFSCPPRATAALAVFDATGRVIRQLGEGIPGGEHRIDWDGRNQAGRPAPAGTYFVRLSAGAASVSRPILLLR